MPIFNTTKGSLGYRLIYHFRAYLCIMCKNSFNNFDLDQHFLRDVILLKYSLYMSIRLKMKALFNLYIITETSKIK